MSSGLLTVNSAKANTSGVVRTRESGPEREGPSPPVQSTRAVDGWAAKKTAAALRVAPRAIDVAAGKATIGFGMQGDSVTDVQRWLIKNGADMFVDGKFGETTRSALRTVQAALGLPVTGVVDQNTQEAIDASSFKVPGGFTAAPSLDDVRAGKAELKRGMAGFAVAEMQRRLNAAGMKPALVVDGLMGPFTERALQTYQDAAGVGVTGAGDSRSIQSLDSDLASGTQRALKPYFEAAMKASRAKVLEAGIREQYDSNGELKAPAQLGERQAAESADERNGLARAAVQTAQQLSARAPKPMRFDPKTGRMVAAYGSCSEGVRLALEKMGVSERHASAYQWADSLAGRRDFNEIKVTKANLQNLPPGCVVVYGRSSEHPHGHVTISLGGGKEASDKLRGTVNPALYGDVRAFVPV